MPHLRPEASEYAPHHEKYISLIASPILPALRSQRDQVRDALLTIPESRGGERYQPDKWTVREVIGHLSDAERVYQYRATAIARGDTSPLPKYDPDGYVATANFDSRTIESLVDEFVKVREATLALFENLPHEAWPRAAQFGSSAVSVRAWAHIAGGHVAQHVNVLRERYHLEV